MLFDIDGTLVQTAGAGVRGMNAAFEALHGWDAALDGVPIAGRTDRAIVTDVFRAAGVEPTNEAIGALRDAYVRHLPAELARSATGPFGVLPGVQTLLDHLAARPDVHVALLTGNFEKGAAIKLGHFDLWRRFLFGAFGDDHVHRRDLVPVARDRCRRAGIDVQPTSIVVIGDTPLDVDCARAHGVRAVAVATGLYSRQVLGDAGADLVVETLEELAADGEWIARVASGAR